MQSTHHEHSIFVNIIKGNTKDETSLFQKQNIYDKINFITYILLIKSWGGTT